MPYGLRAFGFRSQFGSSAARTRIARDLAEMAVDLVEQRQQVLLVPRAARQAVGQERIAHRVGRRHLEALQQLAGAQIVGAARVGAALRQVGVAAGDGGVLADVPEHVGVAHGDHRQAADRTRQHRGQGGAQTSVSREWSATTISIMTPASSVRTSAAAVASHRTSMASRWVVDRPVMRVESRIWLPLADASTHTEARAAPPDKQVVPDPRVR